MRIGRRQFVAGAAVAGAAAALPARAMGRGAALAIFDGRDKASRAFAAQAKRAGIATLDFAADEAEFWKQARAGFGLPQGAAIVGNTCWDVRVYLASVLAERRMRVREERRDADRFEWRIA